MPYHVMVKIAGRWAAPWSFDTWNDAKQRAADVRRSAAYKAVKIRKVTSTDHNAKSGVMASDDEGAIACCENCGAPETPDNLIDPISLWCQQCLSMTVR